MRNRLSSISTDENQLMSYLKVTWPSTQHTFNNHQSSSPTPTSLLLHLPPAAGRRSASPSSASPGGSRDRSPSLGTGRDRSPSAGTVSSHPFLTVSVTADQTTTSAVDTTVELNDRISEDRLQAPSEDRLQAPTAWDSGSAADSSSSTATGGMQRPVSLYSRRRTILKAIREKSLSIDVDLQRTPSANDVILPRS